MPLKSFFTMPMFVPMNSLLDSTTALDREGSNKELHGLSLLEIKSDSIIADTVPLLIPHFINPVAT